MRIPVLDSLRGLMLVLMTLVHLPGFPGRAVDQLFGFVGSAEGLIFLSGLLVGLRYTKMFAAEAPNVSNGAIVAKKARSRLFARARTIYLVQLSVVVLFIVLEALLPTLGRTWREFSAPVPGDSFFRILRAAALLYQPRYLDILGMFVGLFLIAPYAVAYLARGHVRSVLSVSFCCWALSQVFDPLRRLVLFLGSPAELALYDQSPFRLISWQLLFVLGIYIGVRRYRLGRPLDLRLSTALLASAIVAVSMLWRHGWLSIPISDALLPLLLHKKTLGLLRILDVLSIACVLYFICRRMPGSLYLRWLALLGRHPLQVYSFHVVLLYMAAALRDPWHFTWPWPLQLAGVAAVLTLLTAVAWLSAKWTGRDSVLQRRDSAQPIAA